MGLTGFNRQRKRALADVAGGDNVIVDRLFAHGYTTPELVKKATAKDLFFLSEKELKAVKGKKAKKAQAKLDEAEEPATQDESTDSEADNAEELDEEFLALPEDTEFPHKFSGGWHYLSNGEKVNGKANAEKAQAKLDGQG